MFITPKQIAVKYSPPRICLIYSMNKESFFHEFPVSVDDLKMPTESLYKKLKVLNPGYLDGVDPDQVFNLLEMMKTNLNKPSKAKRLRGVVSDYRADESPKQKKSTPIEDIDLLL